MNVNIKLKVLEQEMQTYKPILRKAADSILDQEVSKYPIFVLHQQEVSIGVPIIEKEKVKGNWSVNASSLEEFATKNLIESAKIDNFKKVYKDPKNYLCLFVLSELGATFVFIPRAASVSSQ